MTPLALKTWMRRLEDLQKEMAAENEPQALMVACVLSGLLGGIAALSLGDESQLRALTETAGRESRRFLARESTLDREIPS